MLLNFLEEHSKTFPINRIFKQFISFYPLVHIEVWDSRRYQGIFHVECTLLLTQIL